MTSSERAVPYHCPFCGGENLWPHEGAARSDGAAPQGGWECRSCLRAFKITMIGKLARPALGGDR
ncbi:transposase-like protein [Marmoricola sp. OAE513]